MVALTGIEPVFGQSSSVRFSLSSSVFSPVQFADAPETPPRTLGVVTWSSLFHSWTASESGTPRAQEPAPRSAVRRVPSGALRRVTPDKVEGLQGTSGIPADSVAGTSQDLPGNDASGSMNESAD